MRTKLFTTIITLNCLFAFSIVDPSTRTLNTSLPVGSTAGQMDVTPGGSAAYTIPLTMLPGRCGMQPSVSITYSSSGSSNLLGLGWGISGLSAITRTGKNMYYDNALSPVSLTSSDCFLLDGQRLIKSGSYYYPEVEDFSTIVPYGTTGTGPTYFIVTKKDGTKIYFGNCLSSNAYLKSDSSATIISWYIARIIDRRGNYINFNYGNNTATGETWIKSIAYTGSTTASLTPTDSIVFTYSTIDRIDKRTGYVAGCLLTNNKLVTKIEIKSGTSLVRRYVPKFYEDTFIKLNEIEERYGDGTTAMYNTTAIGYGAKSSNLILPMATHIISEDINKEIHFGFADFNGDGLTDYLKLIHNGTSGTYKTFRWETWINNGTEFIKKQTGAWNILNDTNFNFVPADFNGDGLMDIAVCSGMSSTVNSGQVYCFASAGESLSCASTNYFPADNINYVFAGDVNSDGKSEFIVNNATLKIGNYADKDLTKLPTFTSTGLSGVNTYSNYVADVNGDSKPELVALTANYLKIYSMSMSSYSEIASLAMDSPAYTQIFPGDFNGDRLLDVLVKYTADFNQQVGTVYIFTGSGFTLAGLSTLLNVITANYSTFYLGDYNFDGRTDIMVAYWNTNQAYFNLKYNYSGTSGFTTTVITGKSGIPYANQQNVLSYIDFNGDGVEDVFRWQVSLGLASTYIHNSNDTSSYVTRISSGTGKLTSIAYSSIATPGNGVYTKGAGATYPLIDIQCPYYVVNSLTEKADGVTHTSNSYSYASAKLHLLGKGFLGFSQFTVKNLLTNFTNTFNYSFKTTSDYKYYYPYLSSSVTSLGSNTVSTSSTAISITPYTSSLRFLPLLTSVYSNNYLDDIRVTENYSSYDSYGNPLTVTEIYKTDDNSTQGNGTTDATITTNTTWWPSTNSYLPLTTKVTSQRSGQPDNIRNTTYSYTTTHLLDTVKSDPGTAFEVWVDNDYDVCGNLTQSRTLDTKGTVLRKTTCTYDSYKRFATKVTNGLGHSISYTYDAKTGNVLTAINAQGIKTTNTYDNFGKLLTTTTPDGISSVTYSWSNDASINYDKFCIKKTSYNNSYVKEYYDAFGRKVHTKSSPMYNTKEINASISYNSKGQVSEASEPYDTISEKQSTVYTYDEYGRITLDANYKHYDVFSYPEARKVVKTADYTTTHINWQKTNSLGEVVQAHDAGGDIKYTYNAIGLPVKVEAPGSIITTLEYDLVGNRTKLIDPDAGITKYQYDLLGQLTKETDTLGQVYTMAYDILGRLTTQSNPTEGTNAYTYVSSGKGLGKLQSVTNSVTGITHSYVYNTMARDSIESEKISGITYTYQYGYDAKGRLSQLTYPGNFIIKSVFGSYGELQKVTDANNARIWEITSMSALGELEKIKYGNGTSSQYYYANGNMSKIETKNSSNIWIQDISYNYEAYTRNMLKREIITHDTFNYSYTTAGEIFTYDDLGRLTSSKVGGNTKYSISYNSDGSGRFVSKSDIGTYAYNSASKHAPTMESSNLEFINTKSDQIIAYTPFQKVSKITQGTITLDFIYGPEHSRKVTELRNSSTLVKKKTYVGNLYELEEDASGNKRHLYYIPGPTGEAAIFVKTNSGTAKPYYIHKDCLGSYDVVTDSLGKTAYYKGVAQRYNFDAWGRKREPEYLSYSFVPTSYLFDRGYTGHEHLDAFGLINMNGRIYDPYLAHFLSPDNFVQNPARTQNYNRYSYCLNNPLKYTDPSGWEYSSVYEGRQRTADDLLWDPGCGFVGYSYGGANWGGVGPKPTNNSPVQGGGSAYLNPWATNDQWLMSASPSAAQNSMHQGLIYNRQLVGMNYHYETTRSSYTDSECTIPGTKITNTRVYDDEVSKPSGQGDGEGKRGWVISEGNAAGALGPVGGMIDVGIVVDSHGDASHYLTIGWVIGYGGSVGVGASRTSKGFNLKDFPGWSEGVMIQVPFTPAGIEGFKNLESGCEYDYLGNKYSGGGVNIGVGAIYGGYKSYTILLPDTYGEYYRATGYFPLTYY